MGCPQNVCNLLIPFPLHTELISAIVCFIGTLHPLSPITADVLCKFFLGGGAGVVELVEVLLHVGVAVTVVAPHCKKREKKTIDEMSIRKTLMLKIRKSAYTKARRKVLGSKRGLDCWVRPAT